MNALLNTNITCKFRRICLLRSQKMLILKSKASENASEEENVLE
jgi:hypothetical protein